MNGIVTLDWLYKTMSYVSGKGFLSTPSVPIYCMKYLESANNTKFVCL